LTKHTTVNKQGLIYRGNVSLILLKVRELAEQDEPMFWRYSESPKNWRVSFRIVIKKGLFL